MNTDVIDAAFIKLMQQKSVGKSIGIDNAYAAKIRYKLRNSINISTDFKLSLLQKSGWRQSDNTFSQKDLVLLAKFVLRSSASAKAHGAEYLVEKFIAAKK